MPIYGIVDILHAVLLLPLEVLLPQSVDAVNHDLDQLHLGVAETVLVGDIVGATGLATRFSAGATGLDSELFTPGLELVDSLLGPSGEVAVDGSAHASSQVGGAGVDIAVLLVEHEVLAGLGLHAVTDSLDAAGKAIKDSLDITTLLHRDDAELILLIDPDEEGLGIIVEDSTAFGPVTLHTGNSEIGISGHEEEMIINKLLADFLIHTSKRIVGSGKISRQSSQSSVHELLNSNALFLGDSGGQAESIDGATNADTGGVDGNVRVDVSGDLADIHVGGVLSIGTDAMVFLNDGIEHLGEVLVGIPISGVDSAVLVVELNSAGNGLGEGEAGGLGDDVLVFVPSLLGHVLGHQRVGGLDGGEFARHGCFGL